MGELKKAKVLYVKDGDSVFVSYYKDVVEIRLYAIDCPEDGQDWGEAATTALIKLIANREVFLETHGLDHYGRLLATVYVEQKSQRINVNEQMVKCGHAWVRRKYYTSLSKSRKHRLVQLVKWAKSNEVGLWKQSKPIAPWIWRKQRSAA